MNERNHDQPTAGTLGWKISTAVLAVLLIVSLLLHVFGSRAGSAEAVATVNGVKITKDELFDEMAAYGGSSVLDDLIRQEVIRQAVEEAGKTASDEEVQARMEKFAEPYGSMDAFLAEIAYYGYSEEMLREQVATQIKIEKIIGADVAVTDEEIAAYFEENKDSFDKPETVRASHILVETREEAESLLKQLEAGADFAELAAEHTLDEMTKESGGDVGDFARGEMEEGFEETAFSLEIGETAIAETSYGFHVVRVTDKSAAQEATLDSAREEIVDYLTQSKLADLVDGWIADREAEADIEYLMEW
ncbi:parvulin-like peptidyl-prolyl isomerase [Thermobacillus composti KWC4]|uniref:peptidylprolyl isomerase n=1 Tax=Thermobacillus composti (strain DSM 18247 / JCM 13945 / KWC4) TaxID=717605 RepID=L0ED74_THECK|nr:peptidylprolyl isomerase [Thermobacillus composti]AGA57737.1 parvulin-like peptidyl-prolyl isomerase [Thermobacillus composti KWC4]